VIVSRGASNEALAPMGRNFIFTHPIRFTSTQVNVAAAARGQQTAGKRKRGSLNPSTACWDRTPDRREKRQQFYNNLPHI
jgi:hypothetical protein